MIGTITAAIALADAVGLTGWVGEKIGGKPGEKVAKQITGLAQELTGKKDPKKALEAIQKDQVLQSQLRNKIVDNEQQIIMASFEDRADARDMYKHNHKQADEIADQIMKYNLFYVIGVITVQCTSLWFLKDNPDILAIVSTSCGWILKGLLDERKEVCGFYFGSSLGSKLKNK